VNSLTSWLKPGKSNYLACGRKSIMLMLDGHVEAFTEYFKGMIAQNNLQIFNHISIPEINKITNLSAENMMTLFDVFILSQDDFNFNLAVPT
jgi:prepilin-type processing-associated H-X9-DG protein